MASPDRFRPTRPISRAIADEIRHLMKHSDPRVTQAQAAEALDRDQAYVSERLSSKRAFTTDDIDMLAPLLGYTATGLWEHLGTVAATMSAPVVNIATRQKPASRRDDADPISVSLSPEGPRSAAKRAAHKGIRPTTEPNPD